jgi:hypothetical protein
MMIARSRATAASACPANRSAGMGRWRSINSCWTSAGPAAAACRTSPLYKPPNAKDPLPVHLANPAGSGTHRKANRRDGRP